MTEVIQVEEGNEESAVVFCPIEGEVAINRLIGKTRVME